MTELLSSLDFWWLMGCLFFPSACLWVAERVNGGGGFGE